MSGRNRCQGMALIMALFLMILLAVCGMAFLSIQIAQRDATQSSLLAEQARQLALSGLHDARMKLSTNYRFYTTLQQGQETYSYLEELRAADGSLWGAFEVTVDLEQIGKPYYLIVVRSVGIVGPPGRPKAVRTLQVELDASQRARDGSGTPNPDLLRVLWSKDENEG